MGYGFTICVCVCVSVKVQVASGRHLQVGYPNIINLKIEELYSIQPAVGRG